LAVEFMTPVFFLSDGYIANGAEPWRFPKEEELPSITARFAESKNDGEHYKPYQRNENLVREWAVPGVKGLEHRVGGLEKEDITGNISYDPNNHEKMVKIRAAKIDGIANHIPLQKIEAGKESGKLLIPSWGGTYGTIKSAVKKCHEQGLDVSHTHLRYLNPLPKNLGELLSNFETVLIPELNNGQLIKIIRDKYLIDAKGLNKIMGLPFTIDEISQKVESLLESSHA
jgi:2-oxoglutarate ferredoxin oxidoreductase subunit alpha